MVVGLRGGGPRLARGRGGAGDLVLGVKPCAARTPVACAMSTASGTARGKCASSRSAYLRAAPVKKAV